MIVRVTFFALAKELAAANRLDLELPPGATVADFRAALLERQPKLGAVLSRSMIAVNEEYAGDEHVLSDDAEVAVIPPVSGGQAPFQVEPIPSPC